MILSTPITIPLCFFYSDEASCFSYSCAAPHTAVATVYQESKNIVFSFKTMDYDIFLKNYLRKIGHFSEFFPVKHFTIGARFQRPICPPLEAHEGGAPGKSGTECFE